MTFLETQNFLLGLDPKLLFLIVAWSTVWKGLALWKAARKNHTIWFVILLIVNLFGALEILYIFVFSKMGIKTSSAKIKIKSKTLKKKVKKKKK
jgi:hypothetical protein